MPKMPPTAGNSYSIQPLPYASTPYPLYKKIRHLPLPVLLASGNDRQRKDTRFEFISAAPDKILRATGDSTVIQTADGTTHVSTGNPLDILAAEFPLVTNNNPSEAIPFTGGAIGFFGYELLHHWHRIPLRHQRDIKLPDMLVGLYSWVLVIDHQEQCCNLIIRDECPESTRHVVTEAFMQPESQASGKFILSGDFTSNFSRDEYQEAYQRVIDYIHAGDCYQVNLTQRFSAPCSGDPYTAFTRLQTIAKAPFAAFMEDEEQAVLSFSPERFIQVKDCKVMAQPIKGTRPRDGDPKIDLHNRTELETSLKDRAENLMIVDLLRNDLGRICSTGSIDVPELFETQSFTNVHHLVSTITGSLHNKQDVFELLKAGFPGGSITGTPKTRAMEIINELETVMRSVYCGAFAWIDVTGNMDSNICIRTLVKDKDSIHCWGGGGVVADSIGEQEYQETLDKISLFMNALKAEF
jgi:para-aminobenzoate synthetase component 1